MEKKELSKYKVDSNGVLIWPSTSSNIWEVTGLSLIGQTVTFNIRKLDVK